MTGPRDADPNRGAVQALISLAARDGLGDRLTWGDVLPVVVKIAQDPLGPRNCRRLFGDVNDPSVLATIEDWFHRAASEREGSSRKTERALSMITQPVQRGAIGVAFGVGLAMAIGTLSGGPGLVLLLATGTVAGAGTFVGWTQKTRSDTQQALARDFRRLEDIAKEQRIAAKQSEHG